MLQNFIKKRKNYTRGGTRPKPSKTKTKIPTKILPKETR